MRTSTFMTALLLVVLGAAVLHAQTHQTQRVPTTTPAASDDYFPAKWKTFEYPDQRFKIRLPSKPVESTPAIQSEVLVGTKQYDFAGVFKVTIVSSQFTMDLDKQNMVSVAIDGVRNGFLGKLKDQEPRIIKEQEVTLQGHTGKFLHIELNTGIVALARMFIAGDRAYVIVVNSTKAQQGMGSENDYEKLATAVLDSFQVL